MKRFKGFLWIGVCLGGSMIPSAFATEFKVASYNLENLWDHNPTNTTENWLAFLETLPPGQRDSAGASPQYADFASESSNYYSPAIFDSKVSNLLKVIQLMGEPEIVGLQELESAGNKTEIWDIPYHHTSSLGKELDKLGYTYRLIGHQQENNPVSVTTGFISKLPITTLPSVPIEFNHSTSARDIQVVELKYKDERLLIFNGHFKSKAGGGEELRVVQAKAVADRVAKERAKDPSVHTIVLGDLNSAYYEEPLASLNATGDETLMLGGASKYLYNLWYELPEVQRWEHSFSGVRSTLTHILLSDSLYNATGLNYVDQSFHVFGQTKDEAKVLLNVDGTPFRWQIRQFFNKSLHIGEGFSDHLPLIATFSYSPKSSRQHKKVIENPTQEQRQEPKELLFDVVEVCSKGTPIEDLDWSVPEKNIGRCVSAASREGFAFKNRGKYRLAFFSFEARGQTIDLGLTMTRSYDWRPNIDDSRIGHIDIEENEYSSSHPHPQSNMCFVRKVLQGAAQGKLIKAIGRLGYQDGYLSLFVATREDKNLTLEGLSSERKAACPW